MATYARPDGRIFPVEPANAKDVVALLTQYVTEAGVNVRYGAAVTGLVAEAGCMTGVQVGRQTLPCSRVIVAAGGSSYPATGRRGRLEVAGGARAYAGAAAGRAGAPVSGRGRAGLVRRRPARDDLAGEKRAGRQGICAVDGRLAVYPQRRFWANSAGRFAGSGRARGRERGGGGFSAGPDLGRIAGGLAAADRENPRRTVSALAAPFVPARLLAPLLAAAGVSGEMRGAHLPAKALNKLVTTLKGWPLGSVRHVPLERGEVVAGGVALDEVDSQTMRSRVVDGLFLCGEILDIAGPSAATTCRRPGVRDGWPGKRREIAARHKIHPALKCRATKSTKSLTPIKPAGLKTPQPGGASYTFSPAFQCRFRVRSRQ